MHAFKSICSLFNRYDNMYKQGIVTEIHFLQKYIKNDTGRFETEVILLCTYVDGSSSLNMS